MYTRKPIKPTNHWISPHSASFIISRVLGYLMNIKEVGKRFFLHSWEFSTSFCSSLYLYLMKAIAELNNRVRKMHVPRTKLCILLFFPTCSPGFWNCVPWFWSSWSWIKKYAECFCEFKKQTKISNDIDLTLQNSPPKVKSLFSPQVDPSCSGKEQSRNYCNILSNRKYFLLLKMLIFEIFQ